MLTSIRSPRVQAVRRLTRRSARAAEGRFVVEGPQAVREALDGLLELFVDVAALERHAALLAAASCTVTEVSGAILEAMAETSSPQGILGVAPLLDVPLAQALSGGRRLVCVLEAVADPGNAGTVLRTADAAGADAVVLTEGSTDPHGSKCVRATAGSLWHLPVVCGPTVAETVSAMRAAGLVVLAATGAPGADDLDDLLDRGELSAPTAWLLGNEAAGLSVTALSLADRAVRIPMHRRVESLNVAAAAAICLYASRRAQRVRG